MLTTFISLQPGLRGGYRSVSFSAAYTCVGLLPQDEHLQQASIQMLTLVPSLIEHMEGIDAMAAALVVSPD